MDPIEKLVQEFQDKYKTKAVYFQSSTSFSVCFSDKEGFGTFRRKVSEIIVDDRSGNTIDLVSLAPSGTAIKTFGGVQKEISGAFSRLSIRSKDIPLAQAGQLPNGEMEIEFNPDIFNLRGGGLVLLHEFGHLVQVQRKNHTEVSQARNYVIGARSLKPSSKIDFNLFREFFDKWEAGENDAWSYAVRLYQNLKAAGIDICPNFSDGEEEAYPQLWYDELHNKSLVTPSIIAGRKFTWRKVE